MQTECDQFNRPRGERASVLDGPEFIGGFGNKKPSSVEEARKHPEEQNACNSVLDGPACIEGLSQPGDREGENQ